MLTFQFSEANGVMTAQDTLTSGMIGRQARLEFSGSWADLKKTAVFTNGTVTRDVAVDSDVVTIPQEVLEKSMTSLYVGVYGTTADGTVAVPTVWVRGPEILPGADPSGDYPADPALPIWARLQQQVKYLQEHSVDSASLEWKRIGLFTAEEPTDLWTIDADENGAAFSCREFRIIARLCFFRHSANTTVSRSIDFIGDDGSVTALGLSSVQTGIFPVVQGDDVSAVTAVFRDPVVLDVSSHCGYLVGTMLSEALNSGSGQMLGGTYRNRGALCPARSFQGVSITMGLESNCIMAGSTLEIWGR